MKSNRFIKYIVAMVAALLVVAVTLFFVLNKDESAKDSSQDSTQQTKNTASPDVSGADDSGAITINRWDVSIDLDPTKNITLNQSDSGVLVYGPDKPNGSRTLCGTITRKAVPDQGQSYEDQNASAYKQLDGWLYSYSTDSANDCPDSVSLEIASSMLFLKPIR